MSGREKRKKVNSQSSTEIRQQRAADLMQHLERMRPQTEDSAEAWRQWQAKMDAVNALLSDA